MRYRLRTLLIVLALAPPMLAAVWFAYVAISARYAEGTKLEWGGVIVLDDLEPITLEDLPEAVRQTVVP